MSEIATLVKKMRLQKKLSQRELAVLLGLKNRHALARIESGHKTISYDTFVAICGFCDVTPVEILKEYVEEYIHFIFQVQIAAPHIRASVSRLLDTGTTNSLLRVVRTLNAFLRMSVLTNKEPKGSFFLQV